MPQALSNGDFTWLSDDEGRAAEVALAGSEEMREAFFRVNHETLGWYRVTSGSWIFSRTTSSWWWLSDGARTNRHNTRNAFRHTHYRLLFKYFHANAPGCKLIFSLLTKKKYVVFGQLLEHYLKRGMRLTKVHRAIKFTAFAYLAGYIKNNTEWRYENRNVQSKKNFYKLMNNSLYGKTIENVTKRSNMKLITSLEKMRKLAEQPHFINLRVLLTIYSESKCERLSRWSTNRFRCVSLL